VSDVIRVSVRKAPAQPILTLRPLSIPISITCSCTLVQCVGAVAKIRDMGCPMHGNIP
jgi:hypothetical protein